MSKEQLETGFVIETAKREVVIAKGINNTRDYVNLPIDLVLVLIEQAERVQELEEVNKTNYGIASDFKFENLVLEQQNKRYREALEFYANENNYEIWNSMAVRSTEINRDKGYKARKALKGDKQ